MNIEDAYDEPMILTQQSGLSGWDAVTPLARRGPSYVEDDENENEGIAAVESQPSTSAVPTRSNTSRPYTWCAEKP